MPAGQMENSIVQTYYPDNAVFNISSDEDDGHDQDIFEVYEIDSDSDDENAADLQNHALPLIAAPKIENHQMNLLEGTVATGMNYNNNILTNEEIPLSYQAAHNYLPHHTESKNFLVNIISDVRLPIAGAKEHEADTTSEWSTFNFFVFVSVIKYVLW